MGRLGFATATIFVALQVILSTALTARAQLAVGQEGTLGGPRVVLGSDPKTSQRYVQVTGRGAPVYPTVDIACDGTRWTMPLTRSEDGAIYAISRNLVETMLNAVECRLFLPDQEITLTRTQLWAAWGSATRAAGAPQILVGQVVEVIDGNTILVNLGNRAETVRYIGINPQEANRSPRSVEPVVGEAAEANRQLVGRQQIRLELDAHYGEYPRRWRVLAREGERQWVVAAPRYPPAPLASYRADPHRVVFDLALPTTRARGIRIEVSALRLPGRKPPFEVPPEYWGWRRWGIHELHVYRAGSGVCGAAGLGGPELERSPSPLPP